MPLLSFAAVAPADANEVRASPEQKRRQAMAIAGSDSKAGTCCMDDPLRTHCLRLLQSISLFAVQPTAIQQYHLAARQCCPDPQANPASLPLQQPVLSPAGSSPSVGRPSVHQCLHEHQHAHVRPHRCNADHPRCVAQCRPGSITVPVSTARAHQRACACTHCGSVTSCCRLQQ